MICIGNNQMNMLIGERKCSLFTRPLKRKFVSVSPVCRKPVLLHSSVKLPQCWFYCLNFPARHGCLKMLREQKSSWNYSKGWDKGSTTSLLEEPAGQQCGWVRSQLLALLPLGTWESILTLLTFYQPNASVNLNLIRAKQNGETLWHHQLLAEEWISEKLIWSSYCHLTHSLMCDLVFWWTSPSFILHFCFSFNKKFT